MVKENYNQAVSSLKNYRTQLLSEMKEIQNKVEVIDELHHTPWGSYKFVIKDQDGNKLGFSQISK